MQIKKVSRYTLVLAIVFATSACTDSNFKCGSEPVRDQVLKASKDRFTAQLLREYSEEEIADTRELFERARSDASRIKISGTRQIRRNYLEGELLCVATVTTSRDANLNVSYLIKKGEDSLNVTLR